MQMDYTLDFDKSGENFCIHRSHKPFDENIIKDHYHSAWEFYFYLGDSMTFFINDRSYSVEKFDLVFVDRHVYHKTRYKNDEKERILVMLRGDFFDIFADKKPIYDYLLNISKFAVLSFDNDSKKVICEKFFRLADFYEKNRDDKVTQQIFFADILATINQMIATKHVLMGTTLKTKNSRTISQITSYINNNYAEKLSLDFLAEKFYVDKFHLCHIFKKETGMTIRDFINQKRIVEAGILLKTTKRTIYDITTAVGFQNQNYFGVMFKKQYGMSPREYRAMG